MKQLNYSIIFLLCLTKITYAQNQANIWYFGDQAGLDFNSGMPVPLLDSQMTTQKAFASIADTNGGFVLYP